MLWHNPTVAQDNLEFGAKVGAWDAADESPKSFAHVAVAAQVGCSWCLDVGYFQAQSQNLDLAQGEPGAALAGVGGVHAARARRARVRRGDDDHAADPSQVRAPRAYVMQVVTRQALNRLRTLSRSREEYVGEWLPEIMAPDVVLIADGGGVVPAALAPIQGAESVAKVLAGPNRLAAAVDTTTEWLNGAPAGRIEFDGQLGAAVSLVVQNGRVCRIYLMRNPLKLALLDEPAELGR